MTIVSINVSGLGIIHEFKHEGTFLSLNNDTIVTIFGDFCKNYKVEATFVSILWGFDNSIEIVCDMTTDWVREFQLKSIGI